MCLGMPGRVLRVREEHGIRMAAVDFGGVVKDVCLAFLPEVGVGDYTIVHVGFAITKLDEEAALASLQTFREAGLLEDGPDGTAGLLEDGPDGTAGLLEDGPDGGPGPGAGAAR